jgi:hypothetical protein
MLGLTALIGRLRLSRPKGTRQCANLPITRMRQAIVRAAAPQRRRSDTRAEVLLAHRIMRPR